MAYNMGGHRITLWHDHDDNCWQVAVGCLDAYLELHAEVTLAVGPFDVLQDTIQAAIDSCHSLGGWRAHQLQLLDD